MASNSLTNDDHFSRNEIIVKLYGEEQESNVKDESDNKDDNLFDSSGAIEPPYNPERLYFLYEHSNALRPNIDSYAVNIDGHGHNFVPVIDLDSETALDAIKDEIYLEMLNSNTSNENIDLIEYPSDELANSRIEKMKILMRLEKSRLETFFKFCCIDESFVSLRKKTRQDREITGNAYWEVLRDSSGTPSRFVYIPSFTVRLLSKGYKSIPVKEKIKTSKLIYEDITINRKFRLFVQIYNSHKVYFKEFGDPRIVSSVTGNIYASYDLLQASEKKDGVDCKPATEIIHFNIHCGYSPYGVCRWTGTMLSVVGSRQSEEINVSYFDNKSVPPLALIVEGGTLSSASMEKIEDFVRLKLHGRKNFHKILVIEGITSNTGSLDSAKGNKMHIKLQPLTMAQHSDALFQNYDSQNMDKIGMSFRLPRLLRGDVRDFNRATAEAALEFTETQVFAPERNEFDWFINRRLLPALNIVYWEFASNSPKTTNSEALTNMVEKMVGKGILTPDEGREIAQEIFNRDFRKIPDLWSKLPQNILTAGILPDEYMNSNIAVNAITNSKSDDKSKDDKNKDDKIKIAKKVYKTVENKELFELASKLKELQCVVKAVEIDISDDIRSDILDNESEIEL